MSATSELAALRLVLIGKGATGRPVALLAEVAQRLERLEAVAAAARSLRNSNRIGSVDLVVRDEGRLDRALDALDGSA